MRDIKFRSWEYAHERTQGIGWADSPIIWKINYKPNVYGSETSGEGDTVNLNDAFGNGGDADYEMKNKMVFMQYTGLKDKNGVEIYEGDIVRLLRRDWSSQLDTYPELSHKQYLDMLADRVEVIFTQGEFCMEKTNKLGSKTYIGFNDGGHKDIFEVIGNIYENPELL